MVSDPRQCIHPTRHRANSIKSITGLSIESGPIILRVPDLRGGKAALCWFGITLKP